MASRLLSFDCIFPMVLLAMCIVVLLLQRKMNSLERVLIDARIDDLEGRLTRECLCAREAFAGVDRAMWTLASQTCVGLVIERAACRLSGAPVRHEQWIESYPEESE